MSDEPIRVEMARPVSFEFCDCLNIVAFWSDGFLSFFVCVSLLCEKFKKDRRRRVLPLKEFEAEIFSMS